MILKINLVLARPRLVMTCLGKQPHLFQSQTDLAADVFPSVERRDVKISAEIMREMRRFAVVVGFEQIKFAFRAELNLQIHFFRGCNSVFQKVSGIQKKRCAVARKQVAEKARDTPLRRPPRQNRQGIEVGTEHGVVGAERGKTLYRGGVKGNPARNRALKVRGVDGDIFLYPKQVAESQPDKFDIVGANKLKSAPPGG